MWKIILAILGIAFVIFMKYRDYQDKEALKNSRNKLKPFIDTLNKKIFDGLGSITAIDDTEFSLYKRDNRQVIRFRCFAGSVYVNYFLDGELIHVKEYRELSVWKWNTITDEEQIKLANQFFEEIEQKQNK